MPHLKAWRGDSGSGLLTLTPADPRTWIAVAAWVLLLVGLVAGMRGRRQVIRRVGAVVARLDERPAGVEGGGGNLESALSRLERTADRANTRLADGRHEHDRLMAVLDAFEEGVVLVNETGRVLYRNRSAAQVVEEQGLLEGTLRDMLRDAVRGVEATVRSRCRVCRGALW